LEALTSQLKSSFDDKENDDTQLQTGVVSPPDAVVAAIAPVAQPAALPVQAAAPKPAAVAQAPQKVAVV